MLLVLELVGISVFLGKGASKKTKLISGIIAIVAIIAAIFRYTSVPQNNPIEPEIFQSFNPIFIVIFNTFIVRSYLLG